MPEPHLNARRPEGSRPLVFAHRGASEHAPEHTLAAYRRAVADGVDGVECDVRLTTDGHLVCVHDRQLARTSNGRGHVSAHSLAELERLDFGSWYQAARSGVAAGTGTAAAHRSGAAAAVSGPAGTRPGGTGLSGTGPSGAGLSAAGPAGGETVSLPDLVGDPAEARAILTLDKLISTLLDLGGQDGRAPVDLLVETKHPTRFGNRVEVRLVRLLKRYGLDRPEPTAPVRVSVMSFSPRAIRVIRRLAPSLPTVLLMEFLPPGLFGGGRLPFDAAIAGPSLRTVRSRPAMVTRLLERGTPVYVWTVNEPADVDLMLTLGVEGIISDRPGAVLDHLGRRP